MAKLKDILSEAFEDRPQIDKYKVVEGVKNFGIVGKALYNNNNIMETAKQLADIAESAHNHILGEQDDWFDKISVNKNMKFLLAILLAPAGALLLFLGFFTKQTIIYFIFCVYVIDFFMRQQMITVRLKERI